MKKIEDCTRDELRTASKRALLGVKRTKSLQARALLDAGFIGINSEGWAVKRDPAEVLETGEADGLWEVKGEEFIDPETLDEVATSALPYAVVMDADGKSTLTVALPDGVHLLTEEDPRYRRVLSKLLAGEDPTDALAPVKERAVEPLVRFGDIDVLDDGTVQVDGVTVDGRMVDKLVESYSAGRPATNLLRFMERAAANPLDVATVGLYDWDDRLTIDRDGFFVGFKSVTAVEGGYVPSRRGHGCYVNGVPQTELPDGKVLQNVGDIVTMDRELVRPGLECSEGLHVGTFRYARGFTGDTVMEVRIDPADIVNIPKGYGKLRCVRYEVVGFHDKQGDLSHHEPEAEPIEVDDPVARKFLGRLLDRILGRG